MIFFGHIPSSSEYSKLYHIFRRRIWSSIFRNTACPACSPPGIKLAPRWPRTRCCSRPQGPSTGWCWPPSPARAASGFWQWFKRLPDWALTVGIAKLDDTFRKVIHFFIYLLPDQNKESFREFFFQCLRVFCRYVKLTNPWVCSIDDLTSISCEKYMYFHWMLLEIGPNDGLERSTSLILSDENLPTHFFLFKKITLAVLLQFQTCRKQLSNFASSEKCYRQIFRPSDLRFCFSRITTKLCNQSTKEEISQ